MLKKSLASNNVTVPTHISDVTYIPYITKMSTTSSSNETHPHTYKNLHKPLLT